MRIEIDRELCQGHAECMVEAEQVFEVTTGGELTVLIEEPPPELYEAVRSAAKYCPSKAIRLIE